VEFDSKEDPLIGLGLRRTRANEYKYNKEKINRVTKKSSQLLRTRAHVGLLGTCEASNQAAYRVVYNPVLGTINDIWRRKPLSSEHGGN
jgi:hypothetical protein